MSTYSDPHTPQFSPEAMKEFDALLTRYPNRMAPLLMVLHLAEREFGYITKEVEAYVAELLGLPPAHVQGVVSFYFMYRTEPKGQKRIQFCATLSCAICGGEGVYDHICKRLGVGKKGGIDEHGLVSVEKVECLGACDLAPMMLVNEKDKDTTVGNLTPEKFDQLYAEWKREAGISEASHA